MSHQAEPVLLECSAIDEVVRHVADQQIAAILFRPRVAPVDRDAGRSGEKSKRRSTLGRPSKLSVLAEPRSQLPPRFVRADAKQPREFPRGSNVDGRGGGSGKRVTHQIAIVVHQHLSRHAVGAHELVPPIVHTQAVLTATTGQLESTRVSGVKNKPPSARRYRFGFRVVADSDVATGQVR